MSEISQTPRPVARVSDCRKHMNTDFELSIYVMDLTEISHAESTLTQAHNLIERLEHALSEFIPSSPVFRFNRELPLQGAIHLPSHTLEVLGLSERIQVESRQAFSPWAKSPPSGAPYASLSEGSILIRENPQAHLSFGAIGKGYALDQVAALLEAQGFDHWFLNAGGSSILFQGQHPLHPWRIGLQWTRACDGSPRGVHFETRSSHSIRTAIGVSGVLEQGAHILDPSTGRALPLSYRLAALTEVSPDASAARTDALSTALLVEVHRQKPWFPFAPAACLIQTSGELLCHPQWEAIFKKLRSSTELPIRAFGGETRL